MQIGRLMYGLGQNKQVGTLNYCLGNKFVHEGSIFSMGSVKLFKTAILPKEKINIVTRILRQRVCRVLS